MKSNKTLEEFMLDRVGEHYKHETVARDELSSIRTSIKHAGIKEGDRVSPQNVLELVREQDDERGNSPSTIEGYLHQLRLYGKYAGFDHGAKVIIREKASEYRKEHKERE